MATSSSLLLNSSSLFLSLAIGFLPTLIWLIFWLYEDRQRPEPKSLILSTFILGMLSVFLAYYFEGFFTSPLLNISNWLEWDKIVPFINMATVEELIKFIVILLIIKGNHHFDEPIDALIYMITVSLGFASMENVMFLLNSVMENNTFPMFLFTGVLRFLGSTVLHTVCSAIIGISLALTFYKSRTTKIFSILFGLLGAIILHTAFNFLIIVSDGQMMLPIMLAVWILALLILFFFEMIKRVKPEN